MLGIHFSNSYKLVIQFKQGHAQNFCDPIQIWDGPPTNYIYGLTSCPVYAYKYEIDSFQLEAIKNCISHLLHVHASDFKITL